VLRAAHGARTAAGRRCRNTSVKSSSGPGLLTACGLWYRVHPAGALDLDQGLARSRSLHGREGIGQAGLSAFAWPHHLYAYVCEMDWGGRDWLIDAEDGSGGRRVIAFHGKEVGRGADDEPLARPESDASCCGRVLHGQMAWSTFVRKLSDTPGPPAKWSLNGARESARRRVSGDRGRRRRASESFGPGAVPPGGRGRMH
jgi:hypothetical protein